MATASELQQLYVAYFGRPADPAGLDYWVSTGISTRAFAALMYAQPEFQSVNSGLSVEAQVNQIYLNLFGRSADSAGLLFWTQQINTGRIQLASIANDLIFAATNSGSASAADRAALANKTSTATAYTQNIRDTSGALLAYQPQSTNPWVSGSNFATAVSFMNTATATNAPTSAQITASVATIAANGAPGQTITLTTDRFSYVGGSGNDTFVAGLTAANVQTLLAADSIDGAGGTNTLIATLNQSVTPAQIRNVQTVEASFIGGLGTTLNLQGSTGVTTLKNSGSSVAATFAGITTSTAIQHLNTGNDLTVLFDGVSGSSDTAALTLLGVSGTSTVTMAGIETLNLTSSGSGTNTLLALGAPALTTLNVGGAAGLTITGALAGVTTVAQPVGGSLSGALTLAFTLGNVTVSGGSGNDTFTVNGAGAASLTGGIGNDTFVFAAGTFGATDTVSGGDGTSDTLRVAAADAAIANTNISGIENLQISTALGAALDTTAITSGITNVSLRAGTAGASVVTGPAGTLSLNLGSATTVGALAGQLTVNDTGVATTDVLNLSNSNAASNAFAGNILLVQGYETVNLSTGSGSTAQTTGAITVTPDGTASGVLNISGSNGITTGAINATTINASGLTGNAALVMGAGTQTVTSITGTANADTLIASAAGTSISAGAGNDIVTGDAGNDTLLAGDGADTVTSGAGNDSVDGGAGDDRILLAANLTAADTIDGGAGTNTAVITAAVGTAAIGARLSNIQTLETSAAAQDMSVFGNTTITTIAESGAALAVTNAGANLNTFNVLAAAPDTINSSFRRATDTATNALIINAGGTIDNGSAFGINDEESLTLNTSAFAVDLDLTNAGDLTSLTITGSGNTATGIDVTVLGGSNLANVTFNGINTTRNVSVNAASSNVALTLVGGEFAANYTTGSGADTVTGGSLNDVITTGNGADQVTAGAGNDSVASGGGNDTINLGSGLDTVEAGTGADVVSLTADSQVDLVIQAAGDSIAATVTSFAGATVSIGDVLTYGSGVDIVSSFTAGNDGDQLRVIAAGLPPTLLGKNVSNLAANPSAFFASGSFNIATGSFTITANGVGSDTIIIQTTGNGVSNSLATNASAVVLLGVDSDNLVAANFTQFATNNVTVAQAAQLPVGVPYNLVDTSAALAGAQASILNSATDITSTTVATIAQATVISVATNTGFTIINSVTDTAAAIAASSNAVLNDVFGVVTAITDATVAQATNIAGFTKAVTYNVTDVIGNIGAGGNYLNEAVNIAFTGVGTVAQATVAEAATNTGTTQVAQVTDSAANLAASSNAVLDIVTGVVTANTDATVAQATNIAGFTKAVTYNVTDVIGNIGVGGSYLNEAVNIAFTGVGTVAQATVAEAATNTGTTQVAQVTDSAANLAASSNAVLNVVTGVVTANTDATVAQATNIAGFTKAVTYNVTDVIGNIGAGGSYLNEAVNIAFTGVGTVAQATVAEAAANTGTTQVAQVTDSAANLAASSNAVLDIVTGVVTANTDATVAQAQNIANYTKAVVFNVADLLTNIGAGGNYLNEAVNIAFTGVGTVAQATVAEAAANTGTTQVAQVTDSAANLAASSNAVLDIVTGVVTANTGATVAQATNIAGFTKAVTYNVTDVIGNIGAGGNYLNEAVNIAFTGVGTVAQATVAEAATNTGTTQVAQVTDSAANLAASSNPVLNVVTGVVTANTDATVAQATNIAGFTKAVTYNVTDVIGNIGAGGSYLNEAVNIAFTGVGNVAQATVAEAATNTGSTQVAQVTDSAANLAASSNAVLNVVTGVVTASTDATVAQATTIAGFTKGVTYTISDFFTTVQGALTTSAGQLAIAEATSVIANGSNGADNINMAAFTDKALVVNGLGGDDVIQGGDLGDTITGGAGNDALNGGAGADVFVYLAGAAATNAAFNAANGVDTITGFTVGAGNDRIQWQSSLKAINGTTLIAYQAAAAGDAIANGTTVYELQGVTTDGTAADLVTQLAGADVNADLDVGDRIVFINYLTAGGAQIWSFTDASGADVNAGELQLAATLSGVAADAFVAQNIFA